MYEWREVDTGENILVREETEESVGMMYGRRQGGGSPIEVLVTRARISSGEIEATVDPFIWFPELRIES